MAVPAKRLPILLSPEPLSVPRVPHDVVNLIADSFLPLAHALAVLRARTGQPITAQRPLAQPCQPRCSPSRIVHARVRTRTIALADVLSHPAFVEVAFALADEVATTWMRTRAQRPFGHVATPVSASHHFLEWNGRPSRWACFSRRGGRMANCRPEVSTLRAA